MRLIGLFILLTIISISAFSQKVEDGWKGLRPLRTTRQEAEKILGKPVETGRRGWYKYDYNADEAIVSIDYTASPCNSDPNEMHYDVPSDVILRYSVVLKTAIPIEELTYDKSRFWPELPTKDGSTQTWDVYLEYENTPKGRHWGTGLGIEIWGDFSADSKLVKGFNYGASYEDDKKFSCDKIP